AGSRDGRHPARDTRAGRGADAVIDRGSDPAGAPQPAGCRDGGNERHPDRGPDRLQQAPARRERRGTPAAGARAHDRRDLSGRYPYAPPIQEQGRRELIMLSKRCAESGPRGWLRFVATLATIVAAMAAPRGLDGQIILTQPEGVITIARGTSASIQYPGELTRVSVTDPAVAEALVLTPFEV